MVREKATITLDRAKVREAQSLTGARTMSDVIDAALDRLIRVERLRRDVDAYSRRPQSDDEQALAELPVELDLADEHVDYDALYR